MNLHHVHYNILSKICIQMKLFSLVNYLKLQTVNVIVITITLKYDFFNILL